MEMRTREIPDFGLTRKTGFGTPPRELFFLPFLPNRVAGAKNLESASLRLRTASLAAASARLRGSVLRAAMFSAHPPFGGFLEAFLARVVLWSATFAGCDRRGPDQSGGPSFWRGFRRC